MHVRPATGTPVPNTSPQPLPVPPRWHLRTQVSRKTLFELIQDTLPSGALQVMNDPDILELEPDAVTEEAPSAAGVLPQSCLDTLAATIPMPLHAPAMWNDGDTTPDLPAHWRPITISLAPTPAQAAPLPSPPPAPAPRRPLHGAVKTAGWMLSGAALTFLVSAAAFGGRPMLRALRGGAGPHAQTTPEGPVPATRTDPAPVPLPARAKAPAAPRSMPPSATVVAIAERLPAAVLPSGGIDRTESPEAGPDGRSGATAGRAGHRSRQDRRMTKSTTESARAEALLGGDDAVLPLDPAVAGGRGEPVDTSPVTRPIAASRAPAVTRSAAMAKTISARVLRPIDVEDPFGGR